MLDKLTKSIVDPEVYQCEARPYCGGPVNVTVDLALRQLINLVCKIYAEEGSHLIHSI